MRHPSQTQHLSALPPGAHGRIRTDDPRFTKPVPASSPPASEAGEGAADEPRRTDRHPGRHPLLELVRGFVNEGGLIGRAAVACAGTASLVAIGVVIAAFFAIGGQ